MSAGEIGEAMAADKTQNESLVEEDYATPAQSPAEWNLAQSTPLAEHQCPEDLGEETLGKDGPLDDLTQPEETHPEASEGSEPELDATQDGSEDSGLSEGSNATGEGEGTELDALHAAYMFRLPRSYVHEGYVWPGLLMSEERLGELAELELGEGDVLICSYPKSGTTWISEIVSLLLAGGDVDAVKAKPLHERVPWLEMDNGHVWVRAFWLWQLLAQTLGLKAAEEKAEEGKGKERRVLFTHLPMELLPASVLKGPGKLIYVARNPKDNAVSFFHFHQMARFLGQQRRMEWDEWLALYAAGRVYCGSWFHHVQAFHKLAALTPHRLLFLTYEDMKEDLGREMGKVAAFLGINLPQELMDKAREHCDFHQMKANPMANRAGVWLFNQRTSAFMRKGVVGDWRNYFTVNQSAAFDRLYEEKMAETPGLRFRFLPIEAAAEETDKNRPARDVSTSP